MSQIIIFIKENPLLAGVVSMWLAGVATFVVKVLPGVFSSWCLKHLTTSFEIQSESSNYIKVMDILRNDGITEKLRVISLLGHDAYSIKTIGELSQWVWYRKYFKLPIKILVSRIPEALQVTYKLKITCVGRGQSIFDEFIRVSTERKHCDSIRIIYPRSSWVPIYAKNKVLDSVILSSENDLKIEKIISNMSNSTKYGLLLHGPPGTGKSSLIKAIASELDNSITMVRSGELKDLPITIHEFKNSIFVIEDIDLDAVDGRGNKCSISDVLNAFDGIATPEGSMFIISTNSIKSLPKNILRPGRMDSVLEIGYCDTEMAEKALSKFYNVSKVVTKIADNITVSRIEQLYRDGYSSDEVLEEIKNKQECYE